MWALISLSALVAAASAQLLGGVGHGVGLGHAVGIGHGVGVGHAVVGHAVAHPVAHAVEVYSGSRFDAQESDDGTAVRQGHYSVNLPDGRIQHVNYHANDIDGYVAEVTYDGTAAFPTAVVGVGHGIAHGGVVGHGVGITHGGVAHIG